MINEILKQKKQKTVLVIGGHGFIGRHVVGVLEQLGVNVIIGTRGNSRSHKPGELVVALNRLTDKQSWRPLLKNIDIVINAVGILRQRPNETYDSVHHRSVAALATACAEHKCRLVHISALGLNNRVKSRFLTSKLKGEIAIKNSDADWHIVRPSLVEGYGGYGAKWFRRVAQWPIHFSQSNAKGLIAPINVFDLAKAIVAVAFNNQQLGCYEDRIYELGGDNTFKLKDYLVHLAKKPPHYQIQVPALVARLVSHICDLLHCTPFSFGHYELLKFDNVPKPNRLQELLESETQQADLPGVLIQTQRIVENYTYIH